MVIESDDVLFKYILHLNVTTNSIEGCNYCVTTIFAKNNNIDCKRCNLWRIKVNRYILYPYDIYYNLGISNEVSTKGTKDVQCFTNKQIYWRSLYQVKTSIQMAIVMENICVSDTPLIEGENPLVYALKKFLSMLGTLIFIAIIATYIGCRNSDDKPNNIKFYKEFNNI
ncbi:hypothetical protein U3516DRAFT_737848 [Neocallimastix sp. 'constans']